MLNVNGCYDLVCSDVYVFTPLSCFSKPQVSCARYPTVTWCLYMACLSKDLKVRDVALFILTSSLLFPHHTHQCIQSNF